MVFTKASSGCNLVNAYVFKEAQVSVPARWLTLKCTKVCMYENVFVFAFLGVIFQIIAQLIGVRKRKWPL